MPTPKKKTVTELELRSLARGYTTACVNALGGWATNEKTDPDLRIRAMAMLLDRGWGRPSQDNTHAIKGEIKVTLRKMLEDDDDNGT
jgi:hypothetical protein